jgi:SAUR family protein
MRELMRRFSFSDRVNVPRGCVPVLVCGGDGDVERFAALLEMAAHEFGYKQEGVLRVPCAVHQFRDVLTAVSVSSPRTGHY